MKTVQSMLFLFILGDLVLVNGLFLADSIKGFHSLVDKVGIDPIVFLVLSLAAIVGLRIWKQSIIPQIFFYTYLYILVPVLTILAIVLTYIELSHYYNFLYSQYFIYFERVSMWAISSWLMVLVLSPQKMWKKQWQNIVFILPVVFLAGMTLIWMWPQDVFIGLVKEDNLIENLQVLVLLAGATGAFLLANKFIKTKLFFIATIFIVGGAGLLFIAGDEISWGQRLLGFGTPSDLAAENVQNEVTVHNIEGIHQLVGYGYILTGLYGAFAWILADNFLKKYYRWTKYFVPPAYLFFFFYLSLVYNSYALGGVNNFKEWSEVAELMLYSGISLFLITSFKNRLD